jgi:hypothetical protein
MELISVKTTTSPPEQNIQPERDMLSKKGLLRSALDERRADTV